MPLLLCAAVWLCVLVSPAVAADPIMPLEDVQRGMQCEGRSVVRGTEIATFDVEILDVLRPGTASAGAGILFRVSGPAVDETGIGFGFSGSPIYCPGGDGVPRNVGAIALGVEDYGNDVGVATPIEEILARPVATPPQARPATAAERRARPLVSPLIVSGAGPQIRRALWSAARDAGVHLLRAPATAAQVPAGGDLLPGSAVAAGISSGHIGLSGIGTVAYRDGDRIWAFGHPLESAGERSLLMQGAFVHRVIGNPNPPGFSLGTYKLASPGGELGLVDFDGNAAISGLLNARPTVIPLTVRATAPSGDKLPHSRSRVADESPLNHPGGTAGLSLVTSIAVANQATTALGSGTGHSFGRLCMRIDIAERDEPMRFCNRYVGDGQLVGATEIAMGGDASRAASLVERYDRSQLNVQRVRATLEVHEGMRFARLREASGPKRVTPGETVRVRIKAQVPRQKMLSFSFPVRIPRSLKPGERTLRLFGTPADPGDASLEAIFSAGFDPGFFGGGSNPSTVEKLAKAIGKIHRFDGLRGTFRKRDDESGGEFFFFGDAVGFAAALPREQRLFRHDELRIGGNAKVKFQVAPRRR